jgi:pyrimidine 5'-nucleotidase
MDMRFTTLFFDLDDTLYDSRNGLWRAIRDRMSAYMEERLGLSPVEVPELRRRFFETYGTTLRGLQKHYEVDADEYLAFVHDVPLERYIQPNPELRSIMLDLPQERWIFTNADADHAVRVIRTLGMDGCFQGIIDVRALNFYCKPEVQAFEKALIIAGNPNPGQCMIFDDSIRTTAAAKSIGLVSVLISPQVSDLRTSIEFDYRMQNLCDIPRVIPELLE